MRRSQIQETERLKARDKSKIERNQDGEINNENTIAFELQNVPPKANISNVFYKCKALFKKLENTLCSVE